MIKRLNQENQEIYYCNEYILINDKIEDILMNLIEPNFKFKKSVNCLIDFENKIFSFYKLKNNYLISVGKLNAEDNYFNRRLL